MFGLIKGSHIWNKTLENRAIVQKHSFSEIRARNLAWFWEDNWQQEPKLLGEEFTNLKDDTDKKGLLRVNDFQDQEISQGKWRIWKNLVYSDDSLLKAHAEALTTILEQRNILTLVDSNQLRWGKNNEGNFNLKEAKCIALGVDHPNPDWVWKDLCQNQSQMRIKLFMWLVQHKKIRTWENLRKIGVSGPSRCQLCELQEETMDHLLNFCPFISTLWNQVASIFRQTDRDMGSITSTLNKWRKNFSDNEIINKAWALVPSFLIQDVWKEHNNKIFKNKKGSPQNIMAQILRQLNEIVGTLIKNLPEDQPKDSDVQILLHLGLQGLVPQGKYMNVSHLITDKDFLQPPLRVL